MPKITIYFKSILAQYLNVAYFELDLQ